MSAATAVTVPYSELEAVVEDYAASEREVRRLRRVVTSLQNELNESTSPENMKVRDICEHHSALWKQTFPRARGLTYSMESTSSVAVRRALRLKFTVDEIKSVVDWVFASDFHRQKRDYLMLDSMLLNDRRIYKHLENIEANRAQELLDEGLKEVREALNVQLVQPVDRVLIALEAQDLKWRAAGPYVWLSSCPVCMGVLRVDERPNGWAKVRCEQDCDWWLLLDALRLWPTDLTLPSDPGVVWAPLIEGCPVKVHQLPAPSSVPFAVAA